MKSAVGLALFVLAAVCAPAWALRLPLRSYGPAEGLSDAGVHRVAIGPAGFVWIAMRGGLWRFDGERFDVLGPDDGVPRRAVFDFAFAPDGSLWIASEAGLFHGDPTRAETGRPSFSEIRLGEGAEREVPHRVAAAADGTVWVGTFRGLWQVSTGAAGTHARRQNLPGIDPARPGSRVQALAIGPDGSVWAGTHGDGVYRVRPDGRIDHGAGEEPGCNFVRSFLFDDNGGVWTAYFGGVARFDAGGFGSAAVRPQLFLPSDGLPGIDTKSLLEAAADRVLLASTAGITEIVRDASGRWSVGRTLDRRAGLPDDDVASLARDGAGNLWIGFSERGVAERIAGAFLEVDDAEEPGARIAALACDRTGHIAILSKTGAQSWTLRVVGPKGLEARPLVPPKGLSYVGWGMQQLLAQEPDGTWWVASGVGLLRYGGSAAGSRRLESAPDAVLSMADGLPGSDIYVLFLDASGDLWASTASLRPGLGSIFRVLRGSRSVETFRADEIGSTRLAVGFAEDSSRALWIAFDDGTVVRRRSGRFERVVQPLGSVSAAPFVLDARGRLWLLGDGLAVIDRPEEVAAAARVYTLPPPLDGLTFNSGVDDGHGTLYLGCSRGVVRLDPESGRAKLLTAADGLVDGAIYLAMRDADGVLWFSDGSGLSRLTPGPDPPAPVHDTRIHDVRIAGVPVPLPAIGTTAVGPLTVEPSQRTVDVGWFAVHLGPGEPPRFQHYLDGADTDWSVPSRDHRVLYAGLAPGRYRFSVRAVEADGSTTAPPAVVTFRVLAPVWRRGWFLSLAAAALASLIYAAHRARLASAVAIERVRTGIATDLHDEIGSTLSQISVLSQVAEREAARAAGTAPRSLSRIAELARGAVEAMGETVWAISPREDHLSDLVQRMRRFGLDLFSDGAVEIRLELPPHDPDERLDTEIRRTLWLVFKEALHNARKHASARNVVAELVRESGGFTLTVRDDGRGFDPAGESAGHGLDSMRRRAQAIGGRLELNSTAGEPTTVVLHVPKHRGNLFRRIVGRAPPSG
jgi:signal transduction histidine kinase/streptogramin lyase